MTIDEAMERLLPFGFASTAEARGFVLATSEEQARILAALNASNQRDVGAEILSIVEAALEIAPYGDRIRRAIDLAKGLA